MNEEIRKRISNLMSVKSIVTLILTLLFAILSLTNKVTTDFLTIYTTVIAFYFGTQYQKSVTAAEVITELTAPDEGTENSPKI